MTDRPAANRVPSLLRLMAHDPERQLFVCDDRSLAFGFLCRPLAGGDDATEQRLRSFLALDWPTGTLLGFHLIASSAIHQLVEAMVALRAAERDPLLAMTIQDRANHLLGGIDQPYPETGTLVRDFQLIVTAKLPHAGPQPTEPDLAVAHGHQRRARQALEDLQLRPQRMHAGDACFILNQLLCRGPHATWRRLPGMDIHDDLLLAEQAVDSDLDLAVERDGLGLGPARLAVLSVKSFPGSLRFGMTASLIGDLRQGQRGLKAPFLITTSVFYPDPQKTEARLAKRRAWTTHQLHSPLQRWLPNLGAMPAETEPLTDFQRQSLSRVMHGLWALHGPAMSIDQIATALTLEADQRACDIGIQLFAFTSHGSFGRFFAGANTMRLDNRLVVLELEHLKQRKHLQRIVLLQLIYQIQQAMYLGDRGRRKLVIIDEAWDLLTSGEVGKFIETGYRRFRKYNGAAIVITQSLGDLYTNPVGEAITANSAITFQLAQQGRTLEMLAGQQKLPGGMALETLKSIHTAPGRYTELAIMSNRGSGVARLVVSPFLQLLYSTRPEDVAAIAALRAQGLGLAAAIETLVQRRQWQAAA